MIELTSIWQHFAETSLGVLIFRILEKSCKKCQDETNNETEETIKHEATTESNDESCDSEKTVWDPAK